MCSEGPPWETMLHPVIKMLPDLQGRRHKSSNASNEEKERPERWKVRGDFEGGSLSSAGLSPCRDEGRGTPSLVESHGEEPGCTGLEEGRCGV